MKFGTPVLIERGSSNIPPNTLGCRRLVRGVYIGARGHQRTVRLTEDDPLDTVGWHSAGQVGIWCASAVRAREQQ